MPKQFSIIAAASMGCGGTVPASVAELRCNNARSAGGLASPSLGEVASGLSRPPHPPRAVPCIEQVYRNLSKTAAM